MHIIKKYANRKLYHTNKKHYITLEGVARLVQQGEDVQVIDNETSEDITATILVQIILQARKRHGNDDALPATVLMSLLQFGGSALSSVQRALSAAFNAQGRVDAEIERRLEVLQNDGSLAEDEAAHIRRLLLRRDLADAEQAAFDHEPFLPSRSDVLQLHAQIDALSVAVEQLFQQNQKPS
jgi:polyhydroxyalkanoate synthesis repressor PhaR